MELRSNLDLIFQNVEEQEHHTVQSVQLQLVQNVFQQPITLMALTVKVSLKIW